MSCIARLPQQPGASNLQNNRAEPLSCKLDKMIAHQELSNAILLEILRPVQAVSR